MISAVRIEAGLGVCCQSGQQLVRVLLGTMDSVDRMDQPSLNSGQLEWTLTSPRFCERDRVWTVGLAVDSWSGLYISERGAMRSWLTWINLCVTAV